MKRLHIITQPIALNDPAYLADIDTREYEDRWLLQEEVTAQKRLRRYKHQLAI